MIGWAMLALLMATVAALLVVLRVPRALWPLVGSALMLGAAGYAWQGQPGLAAHPVMADTIKLPPDPTYKALRNRFFGEITFERQFLAISDNMLGDGDPQVAARIVMAGLRQAPQNAAMWVELGNIIALHDHALVSPAALFAYQRAMALSPEHPGPPFFLGIAYVRAGEFAKARPYWARALRLTPADAGYRDEIARRLTLLDGYLKATKDQPSSN